MHTISTSEVDREGFDRPSISSASSQPGGAGTILTRESTSLTSMVFVRSSKTLVTHSKMSRISEMSHNRPTLASGEVVD